MKRCFPFAVLIHFFFIQTGLSQVSVQLKVKESSGFLGMGGPKYVGLTLSNQTGQQPLNSANVNAGQYFYFECRPAGDWKIDQDFVQENLTSLTIEQGSQRITPAYTGVVTTRADTTSVLLGFPKTLRLEEPFRFVLESGKSKTQVECKVPSEYWRGYGLIAALTSNAERAVAAGRFRDAIAFYNSILTDNSLQAFPQYKQSKAGFLNTVRSYLDANVAGYQGLRDTAQIDPKTKIAEIAGYKPAFVYVVDSLPLLRFELSPNDSGSAALLERAKKAILQIGAMTDSLQNSLDEKTVEWLLEGSVTGKTGLHYQYMIETLAYAYSSLDFADTSSTSLNVTIPAWLQARLEQNNLLEAYQTFIRVCNDRFQMRLTIFPVEFLPNLRKDTASFALPFYAMLQAVNDYYAGNLTGCKEAIARVVRSCYIRDLLDRFDNLRVIVNWRINRVPQSVFRLIDEGRALEGKSDYSGAAEKYRQAVIVAPDFAYAAFVLGKCYAQSGDSLRAFDLLKKAYHLDTLYRCAIRATYDLYRQRRDYGSMVDLMTYALAHGNNSWESNFLLGEALAAAGDPVRAVERFSKALELNPRSYETCILMGNAYQAAKDYLKARESFNRAIEIDALRRDAVDALSKLNEQERKRR
ncbi:MAG TPA: tetratricopeptide repeat protein [Bacteroidota bacterium]